MNLFLSIAACWLLALAPPPPAKEWRGIAPLRSTRADVERLLGPPESASGDYVTEGERVSVSYSRRECDYGWRVPPDTVVSFFVYPKRPPKLADLKLDEKKYERRRDLHVETIYYYLDPAAGINYTVDSVTGLVTGVEYYPPLKSAAPRCQPAGDRPADGRARRGRRSRARP